jgi:small conductance mechanosensitive channel|tara:strand:- start:6670 stop:7512 length:843 start_codon:yes stop_codon:yes gene_type:complete
VAGFFYEDKKMEMIEDILTQAPDLIMTAGLSIVYAVVILIIGLWAAKRISAAIANAMNKKEVDPTIAKFVGNIAYTLMVAFIIIAVLGEVGIETASLIAIMGAAGLAVGLALQGTLSNFASGVLLIIFRPIKAGDFAEVAGYAGSIEEISLFSTRLVTGDNKVVILSNSTVASSAIVNYSIKPERRVDLLIGVSYEADLGVAKQTITDVIEADHRILQDLGVTVAVKELGDSSVNMVVRSWVKSADYWSVYFFQMEEIKLKLEATGISIPYPQVDIHIDK